LRSALIITGMLQNNANIQKENLIKNGIIHLKVLYLQK